MNNNSILIQALRCPLLPLVGHSYVADFMNEEGAQVTILCEPGHAFSDGSTSKQVMCSGGHWSPSFLEKCKGTDE